MPSIDRQDFNKPPEHYKALSSARKAHDKANRATAKASTPEEHAKAAAAHKAAATEYNNIAQSPHASPEERSVALAKSAEHSNYASAHTTKSLLGRSGRLTEKEVAGGGGGGGGEDQPRDELGRFANRRSRRCAARIALDVVERPGPGAAPTAFRIWRAGENPTDHGMTVFSDRSAALLMAEQALRGNLYSIDIDHQSLSPTAPLENRRAVGWHRLEARPGPQGPELWAVECQWDAFAKAQLEKDPPGFKYFSPAYDVDEESSEVISYLNTSLTINPATWAVTELASRPNAPEKRCYSGAVMTKAELVKAIEHMQNSEDAKSVAAAIMAMYKKDDADDEPPPSSKPASEPPKKDAADDEPPSSKAPPKKDAREPADPVALAERIQALEAQIAAKAEADERERLLAQRPDFASDVRAVLASAPLATLRDAVKRFPRVTATKVAETPPPTRGGEQVDERAPRLSAEENEKLRIAMGLAQPNRKTVRREGNHMIFAVAPQAPEEK